MTNVLSAARSNKTEEFNNQTSNTYYAVYDSCVANNIPSRDVAFIEQRFGACGINQELASDEEYFQSLKEAKTYVNIHFSSGGEYFSLDQSADPDSVLHVLVDKFTYLIA